MKKDSQIAIIGTIEKLMSQKNLIAADLVRNTDIPQSKISKGLDRNGSVNFSIENICVLADYFGVSVDYLLGRNNEPSKDPVSNEDICRYLMKLVESGNVRCVEMEVEEDTYQPYFGPDQFAYPYEYEKKINKYRMFYFSDYAAIPSQEELSEIELDEVNYDLSTGGNDSEKGREINAFIDYYLKFLDLYKKNDLPRELFETAIEDRLKQMKY